MSEQDENISVLIFSMLFAKFGTIDAKNAYICYL